MFRAPDTQVSPGQILHGKGKSLGGSAALGCSVRMLRGPSPRKLVFTCAQFMMVSHRASVTRAGWARRGVVHGEVRSPGEELEFGVSFLCDESAPDDCRAKAGVLK